LGETGQQQNQQRKVNGPALGLVVVQASTCAAAALLGTDAGWKPAPQ